MTKNPIYTTNFVKRVPSLISVEFLSVYTGSVLQIWKNENLY